MTTISDVARRAGVSPVTVSRVMNGGSNVKQETREKVQRAIEELHFLPNSAARSLRSKRTYTLALLVPDITNSYWTTIARGVEDKALESGYSILLCNTDENPEKLQRYQDVIIGQRVDGVIIAPYDSNAGNLSKFRDRKIPVVVIDRRINGWEVDTVIGDSLNGARELVGHLIDLGHKRIAILTGPSSTSTAEDRITGYCMALEEAGIPVDPRLIRRGEFRAVSGQEITARLLHEDLDITAIFAANNTLALGTIKAIEAHGLCIPQDIALVCFDDLPDLSQVFPFLTVAVQPAYEIGECAAELLIDRLEGEANIQPRHLTLPTKIIVRYSSGSQQPTLSLPLTGLGPKHAS